MNTGMLVLVGGFVGAGVLFYTSAGGNAARPAVSPTPAPHETQELAHSGKTPKASPTAAGTAAPIATPTPPRLTLAQVFSLPRPAVVLPPTNIRGTGPASGGHPPQATEPPPAPAAPSPTAPVATTSSPPARPPSEQPAPPAATPTPPPAATARPYPWPIPTPPTLPPYPDAALEPYPASE